MYFTTEKFAKIKKIVGVTALDATADTLAEYGENISFVCVTGNIWLNPNATAVADATAFKLTAGDGIDFASRSDRGVSIISDATGATYEYVVWGDLL